VQRGGGRFQLLDRGRHADAALFEQVTPVVHDVVLGHQRHAEDRAIEGDGVARGLAEVVPTPLRGGTGHIRGEVGDPTVAGELAHDVLRLEHHHVEVGGRRVELDLVLVVELLVAVALDVHGDAGAGGELLQVGLDAGGPRVVRRDHAQRGGVGLLSRAAAAAAAAGERQRQRADAAEDHRSP
jgi:hypothetical protein